MTETRVAPSQLVARPGDPVDTNTLGGKAAALWRLRDAGLPVPAFAVVTTAGYRSAVDESLQRRLGELVQSEPDLDRLTSSIDDLFSSLALSDELRAAVVDAAHEVGRGGPVAVRSSATSEDLRSASFAGQYRSFLDVRDDSAILDSVRSTWASLWHPTARTYRDSQRLDDTGVAMAVILMAMVEPVLAGVAFTIDPAGDDSMVRVELVEGLADELVAGHQTPEVHVVARDLPSSASSAVVARIVELALQAEEVFGCPQDVEWVWDGDAVLLVQSRPITVLGASDDDGFDEYDVGHRYSTAGIAEMLPGALPPLIWDTAGRAVDDALLALFADLGAVPARADVHLLARVRGQAAIDMDVLGGIAARVPGLTAEALELELLGGAGPPDGGVHPSRRVPRTRAWRHDVRVSRVRGRALTDGEIFLGAVPLVVDADKDLIALSDTELLEYRRRLVDLLQRGTSAEVAIAASAAAAYERLVGFLTHYLGRVQAAELAAGLTQGAHAPPVIQRWMELAATARRLPSGREALEMETWSAARERLTACGHEGVRLAETVEAVVRAAGSRAVPAGPTWSEAPDEAWRAVRVAARRLAQPVARPLSDREARQRLESTPRWRRLQLTTGLVVDSQALLLRRHAEEATSLLQRREQLKAAMLSLGGEIRRAHLELGRRVAARGGIRTSEDIDHLGVHEIHDALLGNGPADVEVLRRRRRLAHGSNRPLPVRFSGRPPIEAVTVPAADHFSGWGASGGLYQGAARVIDSPTGHIEPGDVLVATTTDPSWGPLFLAAGALVVERGGPLSHAAVVARELGLPAVVNVPGVVDRVRGAPTDIVVDGDRGEVHVLPSGGTR